MAEIDSVETQLKEELDKLMKERQICKDKCDRIKTNIRSNRLKFVKNIEEFGEDNELNDDPEIDVDDDKGISSKLSRISMAPSQANAIVESGGNSRNSAHSSIQLQQRGSQSVVCQGYEYHLANTKIDYTFKDEEIAFLVN